MKGFAHNLPYFLREVVSLYRREPLAHFLAILSIALILTLVSTGLILSDLSEGLVDYLLGEATFHVFYEEGAASALSDRIASLDGVKSVSRVSAAEAAERMKAVLGEDHAVLSALDENPFSAFLEIEILLDRRETLYQRISEMPGITSVRDNRTALDTLERIAGGARRITTILVLGITLIAVVLISHLIRVGFHDHRETIETLRLLGAPEIFIAVPFFIDALSIALGGASLALATATFSIGPGIAGVLGPLPFLPPVLFTSTAEGLWLQLLTLSLFLGITGSLFGYATAKND